MPNCEKPTELTYGERLNCDAERELSGALEDSREEQKAADRWREEIFEQVYGVPRRSDGMQ